MLAEIIGNYWVKIAVTTVTVIFVLWIAVKLLEALNGYCIFHIGVGSADFGFDIGNKQTQ